MARYFLRLWPAVLLLATRTVPALSATTITLTVDATDAARKVFHARMVVPAAPGPMALSYPKWIPGEHGPTGPLTDVAGLQLTAAGRDLSWDRDPVDMHTVRFTVPGGAREVEVSFDFISAAEPQGFSSAASVTPQLMLLSWNQVVMVPTGRRSDDLIYVARLALPPGWKFGTALPVERASGNLVQFAPAPLTTLVDSPVLAGAHFRRIPLGGPVEHDLDLACDGAAGLEVPDSVIASYRRLVSEAQALFGGHHYRDYHFLVSLSDHVAHFGLEHHESSDDRAAERMFIDNDLRLAHSNLLPHELVHSWNGKYRRPAGLATPDFQEPMKGEMLWVYEGLTQYLGWVLGTRSGVLPLPQAEERLALVAATLDREPGRTWRPLIDTAVEAQLLYEASNAWTAWRRSTDFYDEGLLIWLEADVLIRRQSHGRRSLDDFCRRFHGGTSAPQVVTYTFDDVVRELNLVEPYDWRTFFDTRLRSRSPRAPLGGIEGAGWRIAFTDSLPAFLSARQGLYKEVDLTFSLGFQVATEDSKIIDVIPGSPAGRAGVAPGMKLVAVNGRQWSKEVLGDALRLTRGPGATIDLLVNSGEFYRTCRVSYGEGARYPRLERVAGRDDLLAEILKPHAQP